MKTQTQKPQMSSMRLMRNVVMAVIPLLIAIFLPIFFVQDGQASPLSHKPKAKAHIQIPTLQGSLISAGPSRKECVELPQLPITNGVYDVAAGVSAFEAETGSSVSCILTYVNGAQNWAQWTSPWILAPFYGETSWVAAAPQSHQLVIQVDLIPDSLEDQSNPQGWEQSCASGQFDTYAQELGVNLTTAGLGNSVIRLGAEMNGNWEADFIGTTTEEQNLWASCFANEVTAIRQAPGSHFLIDWNPAACVGNAPYSNYYPGNSYVDIVGLDFYDVSCHAPTTPVSWSQLVNMSGGLASFEAFAQKEGKPMSFPEWGLATSPNGDDPAYINGIGSTFVSQNFAFEAYFDSGGGSSMPLGSTSPRSLVAFQKWFQ